MKVKLFTLIIVLVFLAGCEGVVVPLTPDSGVTATPVVITTPDDPTPTQEVGNYTYTCEKPTGFAVFLNHNPCLDAPIIENEYQMRPETYAIYERREDGNGHSGTENHTNLIPIRYDGENEGYIFDVGLVAGESGFETIVIVDAPSCLLIQPFGAYRIEDNQYLEHINNYALRVEALKIVGVYADIIARQDLGLAVLPEVNNGELKPFWTIQASSGVYAIRVIIKMGFATAPVGAWIRLDSISVVVANSGYCENAPRI